MGKHLQNNPFHPRRVLALLKGGSSTPAWVVGAAVAGLVLAIGGVTVGVLASQGGGGSTLAADPTGSGHRPGSAKDPSTATTAPPPPIDGVSVTPAHKATGVGGAATVTVSFSGALSPSSPKPSLTPAVAGTWALATPSTFTFTPSGGYVPMTTEKLVIPGGSSGVLSNAGARLTQGVVDHFTVTNGSVLRLQQLMSMLDYSPLTWTPSGSSISATDTAAQAAAAFSPPSGTFAWRDHGWPTNLTSLWQAGSDNQLTKGLVMAFEADHGLSLDGVAGPAVWGALLHAVANDQTNSGGYNFALVSETHPESLTIWHNGSQVFKNAANTGVTGAPTALGTFNVYERLRTQVMSGHNLDGSSYHDPVQYVAYFNGGDAVHYLYRGDYGIPQSLGCVELPLAPAAAAWPYLSYGTVVQVIG